MLIQASILTDPQAPIRHKHRSTSADPLFLPLLVCPCVGVFGFVVSMVYFVVDFLFCLWECVHQRKKQIMRALVLQMKKSEKKKERN